MNSEWKLDKTRILSRKEIMKVLATFNAKRRRFKRSPITRANLVIFRLATCCGLRVSEIVGLSIKDVRVHLESPYINLRAEITKGKKARRVPLWWDRGTLDDLTDWIAYRISQGAGQDDPVVCSQVHRETIAIKGAENYEVGTRLNRTTVRRRFLTACKCLGRDRMEELTIHHGRHSFVSHALVGGRSLAEVRDAAGHRNISTTSTYTHIVDDDRVIEDLFRY